MDETPEAGTLDQGAQNALHTIVSPISGHRLQVVRQRGNSGGKAGRSGRVPKKFSDFLHDLRHDERFHQTLRRIAFSAGSKNMGHLLKLLTRYDPDAPTNRKQIDLTVRGIVALPVMQVPSPGAGETVIDWSDDASGGRIPASPSPSDTSGQADPFAIARHAVLEALRNRRT